MTNTTFIGSPKDETTVDRLTAHTGYKVAMLRWDDGNVTLVPPHHYNKFTTLSADSVCVEVHETLEDFISCSCGFYAYRDLTNIPNHLTLFNNASNMFVVQVALSGKVVVADKGYRATHQRVKNIVTPPCWCCEKNLSVQFVHHVTGYLVGACEECAEKENATVLSFAEFSEQTRLEGFSPINVYSSQMQAEELSVLLEPAKNLGKVKETLERLASHKDYGSLLDVKLHLDEILHNLTKGDENG